MAKSHSPRYISEKLEIPNIAVRRAISDKRLLFFQAKRYDNETTTYIKCEWPSCLTEKWAAEIRKARGARRNYAKRVHPRSFLSALKILRCGYCGRCLHFRYDSKPRKDGTFLYYYGCGNKICRPKNFVKVLVLDSKVIKNIANTLSDIELLKKTWETSLNGMVYKEKIDNVRSKIKKLKNRKERLFDEIEAGNIRGQEVVGRINIIDKEIQKSHEDYNEILLKEKDPPEWESLIISEDKIISLSLEEKRGFVVKVLEEIRVYENYAILIYRFPREISGSFESRIQL